MWHNTWICPAGVVCKFHFNYFVGCPRFEMFHDFFKTVNSSSILRWFEDVSRKSSILTVMRMGASFWNLWNKQRSE